MTNDTEHLFMCFSTIHICSIVKYLLASFAFFKKLDSIIEMVKVNVLIFIYSGYKPFV